MKFTLTIELGNDAMRTSDDVREAIAEALKRYGYCELEAQMAGPIRDLNGNKVGSWEVSE